MTLFSMGWGNAKPKTKKQLEEENKSLYYELYAYYLLLIELGYKDDFVEQKVKEKIKFLQGEGK